MSKSIENLKYFLKEMFQFNENDLDFGIYKIYKLKRKYIEAFIDGNKPTDLIPTIDKILDEVNLQNQKADSIELSNFLNRLNQVHLLEAPEKNFQLIETFISTEQNPIQKAKLLETLNTLTKSGNITEELKDKIYNHILGFFQMYYSNGDFGYNDRSRDIYKVPYEADYNGSDTMFHWKHKGSLYIKSGSSFNAIKLSLRDKSIEYRLETNTESENEATSRNNNKDDQLKHYRFDRIEEVEGTYQVIFNFSNTSTSKVEIFKAIYQTVFGESDMDKYLEFEKDGKTKTVFADLTKDFDKVQNGQIKGLSALRQPKKKVAASAKKNFPRGTKLYDEKSKSILDPTLSDLYTLDQKLNSFYIGHDADYFIHENLQEFLSKEKQRYVKNYIFDDLESIYNGKLDNTTLLIAKAFDRVSSRIIEFLSVIEDFQKHLFTKKKKVVESEYCITLDYINEAYYPTILENKEQLQEWKNLFSVEVKTIEDLKANPTMVLDTKFFRNHADGTNPFKDKVLAEIDDLEEKCNGLLISSENSQSLELMQTKFKERIKTIYIDPPYNTKSSPILYKNNFKHSSWVSLMYNRLKLGKQLLMQNTGVNIVAIDDAEMLNLYSIINSIFHEFRNTKVTVIHNPKGNITTDFNKVHEYVFFSVSNGSKEIIKRTLVKNDVPRKMRRWGAKSLRTERKLSFYPIYIKNGIITRIGDVPPDDFSPSGRNVVLNSGEIAIYPIDQNGIERRWNFGLDTINENIERIIIQEVDNIYDLFITHEFNVPKTLWKGGEYDAGKYGNTLLVDIMGKQVFDFPKSLYNVKRNVDITSTQTSMILDYFAGSGTTGHAVIKLNKEEKDSFRKYVLVEMGEYFNYITKPRIQKVIYSDNWEKGKPLDKDGSPKHIFKYQVLEQYEDVLDNLQTYTGKPLDDLPIKYLYKPEENALEQNLNIFKPFSNRIKYGREGNNGFIDLIETYNYLMGYFIKTIKPYDIAGKHYKAVQTTNGVLVIWRNIEIDEDDSQAILQIAAQYKDIHTIEVNAEFATLQLDKNHYLTVAEKEIEVKIIHKPIFNQ